MTAFRILAERIAEDMEAACYLCNSLPNKEAEYIKKYFKPTDYEAENYEMNMFWGKDSPWLSSVELSRSDNNSFRILILLFAEQHYLHYKKIDEK